MADHTDTCVEGQAIETAVSRARLALQLAASSERNATVTLSYQDGEITFAVRLR